MVNQVTVKLNLKELSGMFIENRIRICNILIRKN